MIDPILAAHAAGNIEGELPLDVFRKEVRYLRYVLPKRAGAFFNAGFGWS